MLTRCFVSISKVDTAVSSERERLEAEQRAAVDKLQQKHAQELDSLKQEAERRQREQVRCSWTCGSTDKGSVEL